MSTVIQATMQLDAILTQHVSSMPQMPESEAFAPASVAGMSPPGKAPPPLPAHMDQTQGNHAPSPVAQVEQ
eukprot:969844-Prorocentrum_lima.AAC.1